jgi:hypothetical protein
MTTYLSPQEFINKLTEHFDKVIKRAKIIFKPTECKFQRIREPRSPRQFDLPIIYVKPLGVIVRHSQLDIVLINRMFLEEIFQQNDLYVIIDRLSQPFDIAFGYKQLSLTMIKKGLRFPRPLIHIEHTLDQPELIDLLSSPPIVVQLSCFNHMK